MPYKDPIMQRNSTLMKRYKIGVIDYENMLSQQKYKCPICDKALSRFPDKKVHVDHDHITKKVRGILCNSCNIKLGWYEGRYKKIRQYLPYNPHFEIINDFEIQISKYTGAPYVIVLDSCTNALFLAFLNCYNNGVRDITLPKHTYVGVGMSAKRALLNIKFKDIKWNGEYKISPTNIYDSARRFTSNMYIKGSIMCTSFHWTKPLGVSRLGAILCDNKDLDLWFRRMIFDGRTPKYPVHLDTINEIGYHFITTPDKAAEGLVRLMYLPKNNPDLPNDDYPDLSQMEIFK